MDGQLDPVKQDIRNIQERIVRYEQKLAVAEQAGNKEEEKSLINLLSSLQETENILLRSQAPSTAAGQRAFSVHVASSDEDIDAVDAETDETPVRSFKVSRSHQGKLFLDGIEKALANRGLVLLGIGQDGFPAHKDGWTMTTYNTSPVQLIVAPKPVEDEWFKDRDLMMKCLMLLVTVCTAIVGIALYIKWRRPSGIPSSG